MFSHYGFTHDEDTGKRMLDERIRFQELGLVADMGLPSNWDSQVPESLLGNMTGESAVGVTNSFADYKPQISNELNFDDGSHDMDSDQMSPKNIFSAQNAGLIPPSHPLLKEEQLNNFQNYPLNQNDNSVIKSLFFKSQGVHPSQAKMKTEKPSIDVHPSSPSLTRPATGTGGLFINKPELSCSSERFQRHCMSPRRAEQISKYLNDLYRKYQNPDHQIGNFSPIERKALMDRYRAKRKERNQKSLLNGGEKKKTHCETHKLHEAPPTIQREVRTGRLDCKYERC
mmetsp:Transcript_167/g.366  ORF Transcript_167/g.366 Transcript_167/m.366 type:complete len:285 (+) Transcript_167:434-1288(+)